MSTDTLPAPSTPVAGPPGRCLPDRRCVPLPIVGMAAEPDGLGGGYFLPDRADLEYHRYPGQDWQVRVKLTGPRVHPRTGLLSRSSRVTCTYWPPDTPDLDWYPTMRPIPAFLLPFIAHHHPEAT